MVDALRGIWRVLAGGGTLVDLRPVSAQCPIEAITPAEAIHLGDADATGMAADDAVADRAIRRVVSNGWFAPRLETSFEFHFYWDTIGEMASYMASSTRMKGMVPSSGAVEKTYRELSASTGGALRLRCRRRIMLAVYRKEGTPS